MVDKIVVKAADMPPADTADLHSPDGPAAKRVALGHATALAGLTLQVVMQFAGKNEGIFIANVCRGWERSYKSTFKDEVRTHRAAFMMSLQRVKWMWPKPCPNQDKSRCRYWTGEKDITWYLGKYAPRVVVEAAIHDDSISIDSEYLMRGVAASGRLKLIEDLWEEHVKPHPQKGFGPTIARLGPEAVKYGYLRMLALLCRLGDTDMRACGKPCATAAAAAGHVHILEFLSLTDWWSTADGPENLGGAAAANNQINVLRWLPAHGHVLQEDVALAAGARGEVSTIMYLLENGCPGFDKYFVACCVKYNRIEALQWCYDTLREFSAGIWSEANLREWLLLAGHGACKEAAKFLLEHGALWPNIGQSFGEDIEYHIIYNDCSVEETCGTCIWSPSFMEWAMTEGCTLDTWTTATCALLTKIADWDDYEDCPLLEAQSWVHSKGCACACVRDEPDF